MVEGDKTGHIQSENEKAPEGTPREAYSTFMSMLFLHCYLMCFRYFTSILQS